MHNPLALLTLLVAALGYVVDVYDLLLFGIVRIPSLTALGIPQNQLMGVGGNLLNTQMIGMVIGSSVIIALGLWSLLALRKGFDADLQYVEN